MSQYIFVADFMKGEAFPKLFETVLTSACNYYPLASHVFQGSLLYSVGPETVACMDPAHEDIVTSRQGSSHKKRC